MTAPLDPGLRPFATVRQWELLEAVAAHANERSAAEALGVHRRVFHRARKAVDAKAARAGYAPEFGYTHPVPPGFRARGVSQLIDGSGAVRLQWVKSSADDRAQAVIAEALAAEWAETLPREEPVIPFLTPRDDLAVIYPVGDHHFGMLSWHEETGADYDLKIGGELLDRCHAYLTDAAPAAGLGVIVLLGDFLHYDSMESVTPTGQNQLDADSRFPQVVRAALGAVRRMIRRALEKHAHVHVIVEIGNHDLASSIWLMEALAQIYENESRIKIDTSPSHFHYLQFGRNLLGVHHGHGVKKDKLAGVMAADQPVAWGETTTRFWLTGHVHQDSKVDLPGCWVESVRILPPADAWAANKGYRAHRDMKAITLHAEFGEVGRLTVSPGMVAGMTSEVAA